jgi:hypothetical protein
MPQSTSITSDDLHGQCRCTRCSTASTQQQFLYTTFYNSDAWSELADPSPPSFRSSSIYIHAICQCHCSRAAFYQRPIPTRRVQRTARGVLPTDSSNVRSEPWVPGNAHAVEEQWILPEHAPKLFVPQLLIIALRYDAKR